MPIITVATATELEDDGNDAASGGWESGAYVNLNDFQTNQNYCNFTRRGAVRFRGVAIQNGSIIQNAILNIKVTDSVLATYLIAHGEKVANSAIFNSANPPANRALTTAVAQSQQIGTNTGDHNVVNQFYPINVTAILQEIVSQSSWASGNSVSFILNTPNAGFSVGMYWYDAEAGSAHAAYLDYTISSQAALGSVNNGNPVAHNATNVPYSAVNLTGYNSASLKYSTKTSPITVGTITANGGVFNVNQRDLPPFGLITLEARINGASPVTTTFYMTYPAANNAVVLQNPNVNDPASVVRGASGPAPVSGDIIEWVRLSGNGHTVSISPSGSVSISGGIGEDTFIARRWSFTAEQYDTVSGNNGWVVFSVVDNQIISATVLVGRPNLNSNFSEVDILPDLSGNIQARNINVEGRALNSNFSIYPDLSGNIQARNINVEGQALQNNFSIYENFSGAIVPASVVVSGQNLVFDPPVYPDLSGPIQPRNIQVSAQFLYFSPSENPDLYGLIQPATILVSTQALLSDFDEIEVPVRIFNPDATVYKHWGEDIYNIFINPGDDHWARFYLTNAGIVLDMALAERIRLEFIAEDKSKKYLDSNTAPNNFILNSASGAFDVKIAAADLQEGQKYYLNIYYYDRFNPNGVMMTKDRFIIAEAV